MFRVGLDVFEVTSKSSIASILNSWWVFKESWSVTSILFWLSGRAVYETRACWYEKRHCGTTYCFCFQGNFMEFLCLDQDIGNAFLTNRHRRRDNDSTKNSSLSFFNDLKITVIRRYFDQYWQKENGSRESLMKSNSRIPKLLFWWTCIEKERDFE